MTTQDIDFGKKQIEVARTIIAQLGGNKFIAMTGSHTFIRGADNNGNCFLQMNLRNNKSKATRLKITLNGLDTYDVSFYKIKTVDYVATIIPVYELAGAYDDMLADLFTKVTGFDTSL